MKTKAILALLFLLIILPSFSSLAQKANFSGEWKLDKEKTVLADNQLFLSGIKIQLKNDSLFTTRTYGNSIGEEYPFDENISFDGKECRIVIYDMPRTSKASKSEDDGSLLIESTTTFNGEYGEENLTSKETWKIDNEGNTLIIDFINKMSAGEITGSNFYNRVK
ncbi:MAG: hypothetical protein WCS03_07315 [Bacteroidota bacterium]